MFRFEFCLPTTGKVVPSAPEWFHEINYDGFRIRLERDEDRVRLITRGGHDWAKRYPCRFKRSFVHRTGLIGMIARADLVKRKKK